MRLAELDPVALLTSPTTAAMASLARGTLTRLTAATSLDDLER